MLIEVSLREGRSPEQKAAVAARVTDVVTEELGAAHERVIVVFREYPTTDYAQGGITLAEEARAASS
jgi:4-oxalocrotonate tautomerase